jgi:hypothetical protein
MNTYPVGTTVELDATFQDSSGNVADPANTHAQIITPTGAIQDVSQSLVRNSVGVYSLQYVPTVAGLHQYRITGDGPFSAANEGSFYAQTSFTFKGLITPGTGSLSITGQLATRTP